MSTQNHYLKKIQEKAVQAIVDDLVDEKQEGWRSRTARDSYTAKLHCLELMGIRIKRDASDDEGDDVIVDGATEEEEEGENQQVDVMDCVEGMLELATHAGGRGDNTIQACAI